MKANPHLRAETLAGAIALGEASDAERHEYREHIAACRSCLEALGGEHEFERLASVVADARESEIWEPDVRPGLVRRGERPSRLLRFGFGALGSALIVSVGMHFALANGFAGLVAASKDPVVINAGSTRIVLEQRAPRQQSASAQVKPLAVAAVAPVQPQRHMVVLHNVVQIARTPVRRSDAQPARPRELAGVTVHAPAASAHQRPERSALPRTPAWRTVAMTTTTALSESAPAPMTQRAESLQMSVQVAAAYSTREAAPVGGETAINPQPPMIAYDEGAEGTTVFEVQIDERGAAVKCSITRSSGYAVLDDAVCRAAMRAKYTPKTVNGRPVPGTYTDAFTFRMSETEKVLP